jgi:hypothetical protein
LVSNYHTDDKEKGGLELTAHNQMFLQWCGDVKAISAIFVQRLPTWDSDAFQSPTTAQTQTFGIIFENENSPTNKWTRTR